jgi:hypothetical protein
MEMDDNDEVNVSNIDQPRASASVQAQATIRPTYDNTGQLLHEQPEGIAVQDPVMGDPVLSFGTHTDDNFTTIDDTVRFRASAPSPASGVGAPRGGCYPVFQYSRSPALATLAGVRAGRKHVSAT